MELISTEGRVTQATRNQSNTSPEPGNADALRPSVEPLVGDKDPSEGKTREHANGNENGNAENYNEEPGNVAVPGMEDIDFWQPKPPKVLMNNPRDVPLQMRSQIHMYAATEYVPPSYPRHSLDITLMAICDRQLSHPLVSPILQGSLGNLCPLYILAGDGEVLRDEVVYLAHRAAHPEEYPTRQGVLRDGRRQKENAEKFTEPTKVHLQVFDVSARRYGFN